MKYRKPVHFNIGVIVYLFLFIYLLIIAISFLSHKRLTLYEVVEKKIADDNSCYGIVLREEEVFTSKKAGYISYYVGDGERISKNSTVYSIDETGDIYSKLASSEVEREISSDDNSKIRNQIKSFQSSFDESNYSVVRDFKYDMENTILGLNYSNISEQVNGILNKTGSSAAFQLVKSEKSGIISYSLDGFENIKEDQVTSETFEQDYERQQLRTYDVTDSNTSIYKLITDESWSIILNLSQEQYNKLVEKETVQKQDGASVTYVNIRFMKDNLKTKVAFSTYTKGDAFFAKLILNKYLIRYMNDRFLEIELSLNSAEGLKIPVSSILEKEFLKIPKEYFSEGGDSNEKGIVKELYSENGDVTFQFLPVDIFYEDEKYVFVDKSVVKMGDWIRNPETQKRYQISEAGTLEGVFNVNKGYCVFRRIEKIYENEEYCIVAPDTPYGLSNYDHILLDAATAQENEIIK